MATYYIVNMNTREVIRISNHPFNIDEEVQPPSPLIQLKGIDDDTMPNFNPATEKVIRSFVDDDELFTRTFFNEIVSMTQGEQDAYAQTQADIIKRDAIRNSHANMNNGTGSIAQRVTNLEQAITYLFREDSE